MPHLFSFASNHGQLEDMQELGGDHAYEQQRKGSVFGRLQSLQRIGNWLKRDEEVTTPTQQWQQWDEQKAQEASREDTTPQRRPSLLGRRISRRVIPELPRPQTFRRQNSERRERLEPVEPSAFEKRALSADRRTGFNRQRLRSPPPTHIPSLSAPEVGTPDQYQALTPVKEQPGQTGGEDASGVRDEPISGQPPATGEAPFLDDHEDDDHSEVMDPRELQAELDAKWILNLSMHFRDKSDREKFFVTYAQEPNRWRRVTVSCDYRNAQPDSLEADLRTLHYQRDKSMRIYEAIRESLPDIQFYDSVTNLKLETDDGRLHVHVTEDVNEIIAYPSASLVRHVECPCYRESELHFESHLSGFVYKVNASGRTFIKKEIPGPDTVDEFLYEINALDSLRGSESVIQFHGLVTDEGGDLIKGLLISFASQGALVDLLFDYKDTDALPWPRREQWARQIITGLSEIHEAGFVQGDFTLSNIVIDSEDNAKIIDINRRGCPVGWEPPELSKLIKSGQRISMVIGVKSDLFQLGMVLWALAEKVDEPEREEKPLVPVTASDVPEWFKFVVKSCLSDRPQHRMSAKELLAYFPRSSRAYEVAEADMRVSDRGLTSHRSEKKYIDPKDAVDLEDIDEYRAYQDQAPSTSYRFDSSGSYIIGQRGRSPLDRRRRSSPYARPVSSSATSVSMSPSHDTRGTQWEHVCPVDEASSQKGRLDLAYDYASSERSLDNQATAPKSAGKPSHTSRASHVQIQEPCTADSDRELMPPPLAPSPPQMTTPCYPPLSSLQQDLSDTQGLKPAFADRDIPYLARRVPRFGSGPEFSPPLHQDSGFDESMIQALEPSAELRLADAAAPLMHANQPLSVNEQLQDSAAATLHIDAQLKDTSSATPSLLPAPLSYHIPLDPTPEPFTATTAQTPKLPPSSPPSDTATGAEHAPLPLPRQRETSNDTITLSNDHDYDHDLKHDGEVTILATAT